MHKLDAYPLWTAIVTPMNDQGQIHFEDFSLLMKKQEEAGNGILILGSTGEGLSLDEGEKEEVVKFATSLKLKVPLMVGVSGFHLPNTLSFVKVCEKFPVDAYLMVTPLYSKPGPKGQAHWFKNLLNSVSKPCMLYNVPSRTGTSLNVAAMEELQGHPRFWSIKEASGSLGDFDNYHEKLPQISLYSGEDGLIPFMALSGACGLVSVMSNVWPMATAEFVRKCLKGTLTVEDTLLWKKAAQSLFRVSNPIPAKVALHQKKWISSPALRSPLIHTELADGTELRQMDEQISRWTKENLQ